MRQKKITALVLILSVILSLLPAHAAASDTRENRTVYLHARGENPDTTETTSTVYVGEETDVYFAVDEPNKGVEDGEHKYPQYDMNGYTLRICYDSEYFIFDGSKVSPIDYTVPDTNFATAPKDDTNIGDDTGTNVPQTVGYFVYDHGLSEYTIGGKTYNAAHITVFFSGGYAPDKEGLWYNLAKLSLIPKKAGSTDVFIDMDSGNEDYMLRLFAKNVNDEQRQQFNVTAVEGGYHHFIIKDRMKPTAPIAAPIAGSYTEAQEITLSAESDCDIYYSTDGVSFEKYDGPFTIYESCEIICYAERKSDPEKKSNTVTYVYKIIPDPPYLFDEAKDKPISNVYSSGGAFTVYVSDDYTFSDIDADREVYYTFADLDPKELEAKLADPMYAGSDPETEWVRVTKSMPEIDIEKTCTVRLVTVKVNGEDMEFSEMSWYYLGVRPENVDANPKNNIFAEPQNVTLTCGTEGAEIFYTTDNSDPREHGIPYTTYLTLNKDTTVRAVARYEGQWSDVTTFWYVFNIVDDYVVDAFYPPGVYEGEVTVTLTPANPDNRIVYSVDGGETWEDYTDTIIIDKNTEIIAKAIDTLGEEGKEYKFNYTIKPLPPVFAPESTQFTNADKISIYCEESRNDQFVQNYERYELFYTLDGSDPTASETRILADGVSDAAVINISGYTVVKAVVRLDETTYSNVVTHSYDIVTNKPIAPITTLLPGYYTREIGSEPFTTKFMPVPTGTRIYYTISRGDEIMPDPVPGDASTTIEYTAGDEIEISGKTLIKAVAVNVFGIRSDIGIFEYVITPETPKAAPSANLGGEKLPVVPVKAVEGSTVKYTIGDFENEFVCDTEEFYIDLETGEAFREKECENRLGDESDVTNDDTAVLVITAVLDGIESLENRYIYTLDKDPDTLAAPYADKDSGTYEEIKQDEDNSLLLVNLYSLNDGDTIEYMKDNSGVWEEYDGNPLKLTGDIVLQIRSKKNGKYSSVASYVYEFVPLAPIIVLESGRYSDNPLPSTMLELDSRVPDGDYNIFYRKNGESSDVRYRNIDIPIEHTMTLKAYVKNEDTGKKSKNVIHYYIIEPASVASGSVYTAYPYEVYPGDTKYIASHLLDDADYNKGIKLHTQMANAKIKYYYTYTRADGSGAALTDTFIYDNALPIFVNSSMADITITAWLIDSAGNEVPDSKSVFRYEFVDLKIPVPSLEETGKTEFAANTEYTIRNDYPLEENIFIYYTTDGSDPTDSENEKRNLYAGETLKLTQNTTVKTVYFKVCGKCSTCRNDDPIDRLGCQKAVYGDIGSYRYTIPTKVSTGGGGGSGSGSGGGTRVVDNTRKYTIDMFGNEHPTHIGYISGYPDGSVQPDGDITREEIAAILYRITNHAYEKPFNTTGEVFPDVEKERWSCLEIEYMTDKGVIYGYPDSEFKPSRNLTRAEFAALVRRFTDVPDSSKENAFTDIDDSHWAYKDVLALEAAGLLEGYEDDTVRPENYITRAEVMTVVNKILGRCPLESYVKSLHFNPFNDLVENKWYYVTVLEATITHNYYLGETVPPYEIKWEDWK